MNGLRIEVGLGKVADNARALVDRAAVNGISITGVTKVMLGCPELAGALSGAGVAAGTGA